MRIINNLIFLLLAMSLTSSCLKKLEDPTISINGSNNNSSAPATDTTAGNLGWSQLSPYNDDSTLKATWTQPLGVGTGLIIDQDIYLYDGANCTGTVTGPFNVGVGVNEYSMAGNSAGLYYFKIESTDTPGGAKYLSDCSSEMVLDYSFPTVSIAHTSGEPLSTVAWTSDSSINLEITFNENVTGFTSSDITISGGATLGAVSGGPQVYNVTATLNTSGTISFSLGGGIAQDTAGNGNVAGNSVAFDFDKDAPTGFALTPISGFTTGGGKNWKMDLSNAPNIQLGSVTESHSGFAKYQYKIMQDATEIKPWTDMVVGQGTSFSQGALTLTSELEYTMFARAVDIAGNISTEDSWSWIADTTAPLNSTLMTFIGAPGPLSSASITPTWSRSLSTDLASQSLTKYTGSCGTPLGVGIGLTNSDNSTVLTGIADNTYSYLIESVDYAGNSSWSSCSATIIKDTLAPSKVTNPTWTEGLYSISTSVNANWTATNENLNGTDSQTIRYYNGDNTCSGAGDFSYVLGPAIIAHNFTAGTNPNTYYFKVETTDAAGNVDTSATCSSGVTIDTIIPTVSINTPAIINNANKSVYTVSGTCSENGRTVVVSVGGETPGVQPTCTGGNTFSVSLDVSGAADSASVSVTADHDDVAGNNAIQATATTLKDTVNPTVAITSSPTINNLNKTAYNVSGTCSENSRTVNVLIGSKPFSTSCVGLAWTVSAADVSSLTPDGTITITANMTDAAGNSAAEGTTNVTLDTGNPGPATGLGWSQANPFNNVNVTASWALSGAPDIASQTIQFYDDSICTSAVGAEITGLGSATTTQSFAGTDGTTYRYIVKTIDTADNETDSACSSPMQIDTSNPTDPTSLSNNAVSIGLTTSPDLDWNDSTDSGSGIAGYEVSLGTSVGATNVVAWTFTATSGPTFNFTGLSLSDATTYYYNVRAIDNANNPSNPVSSFFTAVQPSLSYDTTDFTEIAANNGKVGVLTITLTGDVWAAQGILQSSGFSMSGQPAGLNNPEITRVSDTVITIGFNAADSATSHADTNDDYSGNQIQFTNSAFQNATAAQVTGSTNTSIGFDFNDQPSLAYATSVFSEDSTNIGQTSISHLITLTGDTLTGSNSDDFISTSKVIASNIPSGYTAQVTRINSTQLSFTLSGNATVHDVTDNVSNIQLTFQNTAFTNTTTASNVTNYIKSDFSTSYLAPYSLSYDKSSLREWVTNNGSFANDQIVITLSGATTFTGAVGPFSGSNFTVSNVPSGLTVSVNKDSATQLTLSLTGTASSHTSASNIANLTIDFEDSAFTTGEDAGVLNELKNNISVVFDYAYATVTLSSSELDPSNSSTFTVTATFSESVTGFAIGDITTTNASLSNFTGSGSSYTFDVSPIIDGSVTVDIDEDVASTVSLSEPNAAATQFTIYSDQTAPTDNTADAQFTAANDTDGSNISISWTAFTDSGSGIDEYHIYTYTDSVCTTGEQVWDTNSNTTSNSSLITSLGDGTYYSKILAKDLAGNSTLSACSTDFITVDSTPPTTGAAGPVFNTDYDTDGNNIDMTWATFTDSGSGLDYHTIQLFTGSGCTSTSTAIFNTSSSSNSDNTNVDSIAEGTYYGKITAYDMAGNSSTYCGNDTITIDTTAPDVSTFTETSISLASSALTNDSTLSFQVVFNEDVLNFTEADISVSASNVSGSVSNFSGTGDTYTFDVTLSGNSDQAGESVSINIDKTGLNDIATNVGVGISSFNYSFDNQSPSYTISETEGPLLNGGVSYSSTYLFEVNFNENVTGVDSTADYDITATGPSSWTETTPVQINAAQYEFEITGFSGSNSLGDTITVDMTLTDIYDAAGNLAVAGSNFGFTFDDQDPTNAATSLTWDDGAYTKFVAPDLYWTKSTDAGLYRQRIYYYLDTNTANSVNGCDEGNTSVTTGYTTPDSNDDIHNHPFGSVGSPDTTTESHTYDGNSHDHSIPLVEGNTYNFKIRTYDQAGNFIDSACSPAVVFDTTAPTAPSFLTGTAGAKFSQKTTPIYSNLVGKTPVFEWADSTDATSGIDYYKVSVTSGPNHTVTNYTIGTWRTIGNVVGTSLEYVDGILGELNTNISTGTYYFNVRAVDKAGNESSIVSSQFTIDITPPSTPTITGACSTGANPWGSCPIAAMSGWSFDNLGTYHQGTGSVHNGNVTDSVRANFDISPVPDFLKIVIFRRPPTSGTSCDATPSLDDKDIFHQENLTTSASDFTYGPTFSGINGDCFYYKVYAKDNAGNISESALSPAVFIDTVAPEVVRVNAESILNNGFTVYAGASSAIIDFDFSEPVTALTTNTPEDFSCIYSANSDYSSSSNCTAFSGSSLTSSNGNKTYTITSPTFSSLGLSGNKYVKINLTGSFQDLAGNTQNTVPATFDFKFKTIASGPVVTKILRQMTFDFRPDILNSQDSATFTYEVFTSSITSNANLSIASVGDITCSSTSIAGLGTVGVFTPHEISCTTSGEGMYKLSVSLNGNTVNAFPVVKDTIGPTINFSSPSPASNSQLFGDFDSEISFGYSVSGSAKYFMQNDSAPWWRDVTSKLLSDSWEPAFMYNAHHDDDNGSPNTSTTLYFTPHGRGMINGHIPPDTIFDEHGNGNAYTPVTFSWYNFDILSLGENHGCMVPNSGDIKCWGDNAFKQLGNNTTTDTGDGAPITISSGGGGSVFIQVATGANHTCGLRLSGIITCAGNNSDGQIGNGSSGGTVGSYNVDPGAGYKYIHVVAGRNHTCGILQTTATGARVIKCWGDNADGQLGIGSTTDQHTPTTVNAPTGASSFLLLHLYAGGNNTCATYYNPNLTYSDEGSSKEQTYCWGDNAYGQLGRGAGGDLTQPTTPVSLYQWTTAPANTLDLPASTPNFEPAEFLYHLSIGDNHICGNLTNGQVVCWGENANGQFGNGSTSGSNLPVWAFGEGMFKHISAGGQHSCAASWDPYSQDKVFCSGKNNVGQIGAGFSSGYEDEPLMLDTSQKYEQVSTAQKGNFSCAKKQLSTGVECWGGNYTSGTEPGKLSVGAGAMDDYFSPEATQLNH